MSNMSKEELYHACRTVAEHFEGDVGSQYFDWYDAINTRFFYGTLPQAFILTAITPYGRCQGLTKHDYERNPVVLIHPTWCKTDEDKFYTILHEAIHVQVRYVAGYHGTQSHDSEEWLTQVNRIAKLLGYRDITLGCNKVSRVDGKIMRKLSGTLPYECTYRFPHPLPDATGQALPHISTWLPVTCS